MKKLTMVFSVMSIGSWSCAPNGSTSIDSSTAGVGSCTSGEIRAEIADCQNGGQTKAECERLFCPNSNPQADVQAAPTRVDEFADCKKVPENFKEIHNCMITETKTEEECAKVICASEVTQGTGAEKKDLVTLCKNLMEIDTCASNIKDYLSYGLKPGQLVSCQGEKKEARDCDEGKICIPHPLKEHDQCGEKPTTSPAPTPEPTGTDPQQGSSNMCDKNNTFLVPVGNTCAEVCQVGYKWIVECKACNGDDKTEQCKNWCENSGDCQK